MINAVNTPENDTVLLERTSIQFLSEKRVILLKLG